MSSLKQGSYYYESRYHEHNKSVPPRNLLIHEQITGLDNFQRLKYLHIKDYKDIYKNHAGKMS